METLHNPSLDESAAAQPTQSEQEHPETVPNPEKVKTSWEPIKPPQEALENRNTVEGEELSENAHKYLRDRTLIITLNINQGNPVTERRIIEGATRNNSLLLDRGVEYMDKYSGDKEVRRYGFGPSELCLQQPGDMRHLLEGRKITAMVEVLPADGRHDRNKRITPYVTVELEPI